MIDQPKSYRLRNALPLALIAAAAAGAYAMGWHDLVSLETVIRHRETVDRLIASQYPAAVAAYVAVYVAVVAVSLPGKLVMSTIGGFLFGTIAGGIAALAGATIGATAIFLVARSAAGEYLLNRAGPYARRLALGFRNGAFGYLMVLRLSPIPFWIVNLVPALAAVPLSTFVIATALGIVPATFMFTFIGAGLDTAIAAQAAAYRACLAAGGADCRLDFDVEAALTGPLLLTLGALCILSLLPIVLKEWRARMRGAGT